MEKSPEKWLNDDEKSPRDVSPRRPQSIGGASIRFKRNQLVKMRRIVAYRAGDVTDLMKTERCPSRRLEVGE
jgi:hypothetical protein